MKHEFPELDNLTIDQIEVHGFREEEKRESSEVDEELLKEIQVEELIDGEKV